MRGAGGAGSAGGGRVIRATPLWLDFEAQDERDAYAGLTYEEALGRFERLWAYAREIAPDVGEDWEADLAADLAVARAINGLPPAA